jgi:hypothetical protein
LRRKLNLLSEDDLYDFLINLQWKNVDEISICKGDFR